MNHFLRIFIPLILYSVGASAIDPVLPPYLESMNAEIPLIGFICGMRVMGQLANSLPSGLILLRFGLRRVVVLSFAATAAVYFAAVLAPSLPLIAIAMFMKGFFGSLITGESWRSSGLHRNAAGEAVSSRQW